MNILAETLRKYADVILCESSPALVADKLSKIANNFADGRLGDTLSRVADEVKDGKIPIGNGKQLDITNPENIDKYVEAIKNHLTIKDNKAKQATLQALEAFKSKIKKACDGQRNVPKVDSINHHKAKYRPPVFHGWGY